MSASEIEPHAEVTGERVEGVLESSRSVLLEKVVSNPSESVSGHVESNGKARRSQI